VQNFVLNVLDAQIGNGATDLWNNVAEKLNLALTLLFTVELAVNMFVNWFWEFWSNGCMRCQ